MAMLAVHNSVPLSMSESYGGGSGNHYQSLEYNINNNNNDDDDNNNNNNYYYY